MADEFRSNHAPHFRQNDTQLDITLLRLTALGALMILPLVRYGTRVLVTLLLGVIGSVLSEAVWCMISRRELTLTDLNAVEIGLTSALLMSPSADHIVTAFVSAVAVLIGKLPFGGAYRTPFVPSAVGYCMAAVCVPNEIFYYPIRQRLPIFSHIANSVERSPIEMLRGGNDPFLHLNDHIFGNVVGPIGTTSLLLLAMAAIWLWYGGGLAWQCLVSFSLAAALTSFCIPYNVPSSAVFVMYDLLGGSTLFCALFMISCPNYCPKLATARYFFGAACGVTAVMIQHFGANEAGGAFAALMLCPFSSAFDRMVWHLRSRNISYKTVKARMKHSIRESMKTEQERELDEIR